MNNLTHASRKLWPLCVILAIFGCHGSVFADVVPDGSMGSAQPLTGPDFTVPQSIGQTRGGNLFHGFSEFNLDASQSVLFTGDNAVENIFARVTDTNPSFINGRITSAIENADLYLINPRGLIFGAGARLDIRGSFYALTSDYIHLGTDGRLDATNPEDTVLSSAQPSAFGFLTPDPGAIEVHGAQLAVPDGSELALVGGDIHISGAEHPEFNPDAARAGLSAPHGTIGVHAAAEMSEIATDGSAKAAQSGGSIAVHASNLEANGEGGIYIRGGRLVMEDSSLAVVNDTASDAVGGIDIETTDAVEIQSSVIHTESLASGAGGDISIRTGQTLITQEGQINAHSSSSAAGGDITIESENLTIQGDYRNENTGVFAHASADGSTGDINLTTTNLVMREYGQVQALAVGEGSRAGDIQIITDALNIHDGSRISNHTYLSPTAIAGDINIDAQDITIDGVEENSDSPFVEDATGLLAGTRSGTGGHINIQADNIRLDNRALIQNSDFENGQLGDIVMTFDTLEILGGSNVYAGIIGSGTGGDMVFNGRSLLISGIIYEFFEDVSIGESIPLMATSGINYINGVQGGTSGTIYVNVERFEIRDVGRLNSVTFGHGDAGDIHLTADSVRVSGRDERYFDILLTFLPQVSASGLSESLITTGAYDEFLEQASGNAGNISIEANDVYLGDHGQLLANSLTSGEGGDITVNTQNMQISGNAKIRSESFRNGASGDVNIVAVNSFTIENGLVTARGVGSGFGGEIVIESKTINASASEITAASLEQSDGGDISLLAETITLDQSKLTTVSSGEGRAGSIHLNALDTIILKNSDIAARGEVSRGGRISIEGSRIMYMDGSSLSTSVFNGDGQSGNINVSAAKLLMVDSGIVANAHQGKGGDILINIDQLLTAPGSTISASSSLGVDGNVVISTPEKNMESLEVLNADLDVDEPFVQNDCQAVGKGASTFILVKPSIAPKKYKKSIASEFDLLEAGPDTMKTAGKVLPDRASCML